MGRRPAITNQAELVVVVTPTRRFAATSPLKGRWGAPDLGREIRWSPDAAVHGHAACARRGIDGTLGLVFTYSAYKLARD